MILKSIQVLYDKDQKNFDDKTRNEIGLFAGIVGIIINFILFLIKIFVGLFSNSIAITADAFHSLSDSASSIVTIIGFKIGSKPADEEHPFGHGRMEYISALIVAFMILIVGFEFIKSSLGKIFDPEPVTFKTIHFLLLLLSISFNVLLSIFNRNVGNKINSTALKAIAADNMGDVLTTSVVVFSFLISKFLPFHLDGYVGILVALAIIYAGFTFIKETVSPLLGESPDPSLVKSIEEGILSYKPISGVHDLIIHNYGPGRCMASIHAEIPSDINIMKIHEVIDKAEKELSEKLNIYLVIHMDPICVETEEVLSAKNELEKIVKNNPIIKSYHDFRIVGEGEIKNLIFDLVINPDELNKTINESDLKLSISESIKEYHPQYNCVITIDYVFS
ncbi:cation diffusion facilitator family transporter [Clostridium sp. 'White wine YQ']|uniref:cation diffusion facilitator family transporter n=1 Tax=Clostridium sp. 'White wine YQ' TaxID=3027474 RepID=UPI0023655B7C|nr:cation diffusion facilitator family transporter [Clostridium sp. 'White wine YQ']MDD7795021.1 cation diffusion facilitator family transporter [Clostridium sp. 'White wine YQ']